MFTVLSSWQGHCESSLGLSDECRLSAKRPPTLRRSKSTWAVSPPVGCHHLHPPSPFFIITQTEGWYRYLFYCPTEGRRLSQLMWLAMSIPRWFTRSQMVTHPSTNRARCKTTMLIKTNALPLSHTTTRRTSSASKTSWTVVSISSSEVTRIHTTAEGRIMYRPNVLLCLHVIHTQVLRNRSVYLSVVMKNDIFGLCSWILESDCT